MVPPLRALSRVKRLKHQGVLGGRGGEVELVALLCAVKQNTSNALTSNVSSGWTELPGL